MTTTIEEHYAVLADCAAARETGELHSWCTAYITEGGTYMLATPPEWTDSRKPRDLIAITPGPLGGTRVHPLWVAVDPDFIQALRDRLDGVEALTCGT